MFYENFYLKKYMEKKQYYYLSIVLKYEQKLIPFVSNLTTSLPSQSTRIR